MLISSVDNKKIKEIRKLKDKKESLKRQLFIIEGEHLINEAIKNNRLVEMYILEGYQTNIDFKYDTLSLKVMKSISDLKSTPRVIGICKIMNSNKIGKKIVLLDEIQDPGNLGTIIRTAVAFNIDTIIISCNSAYPYSIKVLRSTQGMLFNANILIGDILSYINLIKNKGIKVIGTSLQTNNDISNLSVEDKYAVIFGNEGNGIKKDILDKCDVLYKIGMSTKCESLNVGVSSGILLYELNKGVK